MSEVLPIIGRFPPPPIFFRRHINFVSECDMFLLHQRECVYYILQQQFYNNNNNIIFKQLCIFIENYCYRSNATDFL